MRSLFLLMVTAFLVFNNVLGFAAKQATVSVVFPSDVAAYQQAWNGFREFFVERKVSLQVSEYNLKKEDSEAVYSKIVNEKPDIVFTLGTKSSRIAKKRIKDIPVVFCMVYNPQEIAGPKITGVSMEIPLEVKLREIRRILPKAKKIGMIYSPGKAGACQEVSRLCSLLGFELHARMIDSENELSGALKDIYRKIDCFLMITDRVIYSPQSVKYLLLQSLREKFPVVGLSSLYTKAGALFSLDCDYEELGRQAAQITLKVLDKENPAGIAFSIPDKKSIRLSLNRIASKRLGIEIPPRIIKEAIEVFGE